MACFLACLGYYKERKSPKCCTKIISTNQVHGQYVPLDYDFQHTQDSMVSGYEELETTKEQSCLKVKKKVSFNLDVKTYESMNYDDESVDLYSSDSEEETKWRFDEEAITRATMVGWHCEKDKGTGYRYQNIQGYYDEEDEIIVEESDLEDDKFDDEDESDLDNNGDDEHRAIINDHRVTQGTTDNLMSSPTLADEEPSVDNLNQSFRHRNRYVCSVLNPVENLTQWKSIKASDRLQWKQQKGAIISEQENQVPEETTTNFSHSKPLQHEIAVNVSLANWLLTSEEEFIA